MTILPFAVSSPFAFLSNVVAFPLGLAHVASPAASPLPGHLLTDLWAPVGHLLTPLTLLVGGYFATRYARRHWPLNLSQLLAMMAVFSTVLICVASATRVGYVIYPLNFALWSLVCAEVPEPATGVGRRRLDRRGVLVDPKRPMRRRRASKLRSPR